MKKTTTIKLPEDLIKQIDAEDLVSQCQSVIAAKTFAGTVNSVLTYTCLHQHLPTAISEVVNYLIARGLYDKTALVSRGAKLQVNTDEMLGKVQTDRTAWFKLSHNYKLRCSVSYVSGIWASNDKDDSFIFRCKSEDYYQALADITRILMSECGASIVRPMKLRKHRLSLDDRKDIQEAYARSPKGVSNIAAMFKISPTSADAFCISTASNHPELFLTNEEVEAYNSVFRKEKSSSSK